MGLLARDATCTPVDVRPPGSLSRNGSRTSNDDEAFHSELLELPPERCRTSHWGSALVIRSDNPWRSAWNICLAILLGYTGIVFPYVLCFIDFNVNAVEKAEGWKVVEIVVDMFFGIDLIINFFFTYEDRRGQEVDDLYLIVKNYLCTYFTLNLVACIPGGAVEAVVDLFTQSSSGGASINKATRIMRLQRMSRLARLVRLTRLVKMVSFFRDNPIWRQAQNLRGVRIVNFVFGLLWAVHLLACGWYLVAALHNNIEETWLERRLDARGDPLSVKPASEQWFHSMYFVLTVFTTVGFGDMSAHTVGEMGYVCVTMLLGAVVHSIIMSEVINVVTSIDQVEQMINQQKELVMTYAGHAGLDESSSKQLADWVTGEQGHTGEYDREAMRSLLSSGKLPRNLTECLPAKLYKGRLVKNRFLTTCLSHTWHVPPRLPLLLSASVSLRHFFAEEIVYQVNDHPFSAFIILDGVFAHIARPSPQGGINEGPMQMMPGGTHGGKNKKFSRFSGFLRHAQAESAVEDMSPDATASADCSRHLSKQRSSSGGKVSVDTSFTTRTLKSLGQNAASALSKRSTQGSNELGQEDVFDESFCPYQLLCAGSYFGDLELLQPGPRKATVRCECTGLALLLVKHDLHRIAEEFPHCARAWRMRAVQREFFRDQNCKKLTRCVSYRHLAALQIQHAFRRYHHAKRKRELMIAAKNAEFHKQVSHDSMDEFAFLLPPVLPGPPQNGECSKPKEAEEELEMSQGAISEVGTHQSVAIEHLGLYMRQVQQVHREIADMRREMKDCFNLLRRSSSAAPIQDGLSRHSCTMLGRQTDFPHANGISGRSLPGVPSDRDGSLLR